VATERRFRGTTQRERAGGVPSARRRRLWRPASLILLGAVLLVWPVSAAATVVTFQPSEGRPGTEVTVLGDLCLYQLGEQMLFSDRVVPQLPDGQTDVFKPVAVAEVTPVGGQQTENGIDTSVQVFAVPRLPAGDCYLYLNCLDNDVCCVPLEPTFRVLAAPDTSTESVLRPGTGTPWWVLGLAFALGFGVTAIRSRSIRLRTGPSR
jgi:hypothetical protein